ncbi:small ribosomal subunit protein uS9m-like [Tubulanus polymorphus]|uniref:small ribosomal subunit protein uS9m-like n=1 Tax=Tubulanus polymorphus TaxID=672921 RepID=UPI003DA56E5D
MKAYLERAQGYDSLMKEKIQEFEIGKRHLANIMGEDPENFTQDDIDNAIKYLLPSALFEKPARPFLKHPEEFYPKRKSAQFASDGRPFHYLFYTSLPNYYEIMHKISLKLEHLNAYEDSMIKAGHLVPPEDIHKLSLYGTEWIPLQEFQAGLLEPINEHHFNRFIALMERLTDHPYSSRVAEFVKPYRKPLLSQSIHVEIPKPITDEDGRRYMDAEGRRKSSKARVRIWDNGTGKVIVNKQTMVDHFPNLQEREQIMFPFHFVNKLSQMDVEAHVEGGGPSGQAGAIRFAISLAIRSFVDKEMQEKMRLAGLLTRDPRIRERKKPGQEKARKKWTWKKR